MRPRTGCSAKASDLLGHAPLTVMQKPVAAEIPYVDPLAAFAPFELIHVDAAGTGKPERGPGRITIGIEGRLYRRSPAFDHLILLL